MFKSVGFGRFMTSEGIRTLILAFTSETRQYVAHIHNRHGIFLFGVFGQRIDIYLGIL